MAQLKTGSTVGGALILTVNDNVSDADTLDGKHASEFAPSGYGLGEDLSVIPLIDSNLGIKTGMYYASSADPNKPVGVTDGSLFVMAFSSTWINQVYFDWRTNKTYRRKKQEGAWSSWVALIDETGVSTSFKIGGCTLTHDPTANSLKFVF